MPEKWVSRERKEQRGSGVRIKLKNYSFRFILSIMFLKDTEENILIREGKNNEY